MDNKFFEDLENYDEAKRRVLWGGMTEEEFFASGQAHLDLILDGIELDESDLVLEVGTGVGRMTRAFNERFPDVVLYSIDKSEKMLQFAQGSTKLKWTPMLYDGTTIPLSDNMIDLVFSFLVFQHIPKEGAIDLLKDVNRVLISGGKFIFNVPDLYHPIMRRDCYYYTERARIGKPIDYIMEYYSERNIKWMAQECGFAVEKIERFNPKAVIGAGKEYDDCHMMVTLVKP